MSAILQKNAYQNRPTENARFFVLGYTEGLLYGGCCRSLDAVCQVKSELVQVNQTEVV